VPLPSLGLEFLALSVTPAVAAAHWIYIATPVPVSCVANIFLKTIPLSCAGVRLDWTLRHKINLFCLIIGHNDLKVPKNRKKWRILRDNHGHAGCLKLMHCFAAMLIPHAIKPPTIT
jgi:hypothetical protein